MNRKLIIGAIVLIAIIIVGGYFGYNWLIGGAEPSTDIESAAVAVDNTSGGTVFNIVPDSSSASFTLNEVLSGRNNTVVGTTNQVAGEIVLNFDNPQASQLGTIRINARTFATDSGMRDGMIRREILKSGQDEFEFIDFEPTAINGLPATVEVGKSYDLEIVGNLTIVGQTKEVTFTANVTIDSKTQISGTATTTVSRDDYGIAIPSVPRVANVDNDVLLTLNFVAATATN